VCAVHVAPPAHHLLCMTSCCLQAHAAGINTWGWHYLQPPGKQAVWQCSMPLCLVVHAAASFSPLSGINSLACDCRALYPLMLGNDFSLPFSLPRPHRQCHPSIPTPSRLHLPCPLHTALPGADHIVLEGCKHTPLETKDGSHWYGSGQFLETWVGYLDPPQQQAGADGQPQQQQQQQRSAAT
jgi:hypothetical protein